MAYTEHRITKRDDGQLAVEVLCNDGEWAAWAIGEAEYVASVIRSNAQGKRRSAAEAIREAESLEAAMTGWLVDVDRAIQTSVLARYIGPTAASDAREHATVARRTGFTAEAEQAGPEVWNVVAVRVVSI